MMQWNLLKARKENNETQKEVAQLLGISPNAYSLKERGKQEFKANEMQILSFHYAISLDDLFLPENFAKRKVNK